MALTVTLSLVDANVVAGRPTTFQVNVLNTSASSVTLNSLVVSEISESDAVIAQPNFLTPNVAVGVGNPTIGANSTVSYTFDIVFPAPSGPGVSPAAFPSPAGVYVGQPPSDALTFSAQAVASDGSVGSALIQAAPISAVFPFPPVATGSLQLQFQPGFNVIALCVGL